MTSTRLRHIALLGALASLGSGRRVVVVDGGRHEGKSMALDAVERGEAVALIMDPVVTVPKPEMIVVLAREFDAAHMVTIKPDLVRDHNSDPWRRQGKRKGRRW